MKITRVFKKTIILGGILACCILSIFATACSSSQAQTHVHDYRTANVEATCQHEGCTQYICSCGYSYTANAVAKVNHNGSGKCKWCGLEYFEDLKSLVIEYGTLSNDGNYIYIGEKHNLQTPSIFYKPQSNSIELFCLESVLKYNFTLTIAIEPLSYNNSTAEGKYSWAYVFDGLNEVAIGTLYAKTFSDSTSSLAITDSKNISPNNYEETSSIIANYAKLLINNVLVPLLAKSTNNITPAHFGFVNF